MVLATPISGGIYLLTDNWKMGLGSLIFIFAGSFGLILFTLETFIYRKIKLIYKFIHQTKATRKEEVYFKDNEENGPYKSYYKSGKIKDVGSFENAQKSGNWKTFYENGNLMNEVNYKDGKPEGATME
jgi:hypothetical protein